MENMILAKKNKNSNSKICHIIWIGIIQKNKNKLNF